MSTIHYGSSGSNSQARQQHPVVEAFRFLAECYPELGKAEDSIWRPQEYVYLCSADDSEVTLSDYYGECHYNLLLKAPKVLSYENRDAEENVIKTKIETLLSEMRKPTAPGVACRLVVDFVKVLLMCPENLTGGSVTIGDLKRAMDEENFHDRLQMRSIRTFLPSGVDALIGVLENLGAELKESKKLDHSIRCVCFNDNFKHRGRLFESSLFLNPTDLAFDFWESTEFPGKVACLINPGSENGIEEDHVYDLRIKAHIINRVEDTCEGRANRFRNVWDRSGRTPPPTLTEPGLDGLLWRTSNGFECEPNAHIREVLEKTNGNVYVFEMEGFTVILKACDGRDFYVDRSSGRCAVRNSFECWPTLLFILDDKSRVQELADLAHRCVRALFDALLERRLEMRPWRCFGNLPGGVNVPSVDVQLLRRIRANDSLDGMLGVSGEQNKLILSNRLAEVLRRMRDMPRVNQLDPGQLKRKLTAAATDMGIEVEVPAE